MTQSIDNYLRSSDPLARLREHAARLVGLQRILEELLPPGLGRNCAVANLKDDHLILHASGGASAVKAKQLAPSLIAAFAERGILLSGIKVRVHMRESPPPPRPATIRQVSSQARENLSGLAGNLPDDSPLGKALRRFIARG